MSTMKAVKLTLYAAIGIVLLYYMGVRVVVSFIDSGKETWNYVMLYVLTFRYQQPLTFICLPVIAVWLLGRK